MPASTSEFGELVWATGCRRDAIRVAWSNSFGTLPEDHNKHSFYWCSFLGDPPQKGNPAKRFVDIELAGGDDNLTLTYRVNEEKLVAAETLDGRYLLGTNQNDLSADEMLRHFKRQEVIERRIRTVKGPIRIRPLFLHKEERIEGLVFVTMLALLIYTILEMLCRRAGEHITARQVLAQFELLGATHIQFGDGSWLKLPSALNQTQRQLIELLRFPPPAAYLKRTEATK